MRRILKFVFIIFFCSSLFALPSDIQQKIDIVADSQQFNYKTGENIYEGNVKIDQGTQHLTADRVVTKSNNQHKLIEATAFGIKQLATYTTVPKIGDSLFQAQAKIIKFLPPTATIVMEGDVVITQGENSFHGPTIIYNIKDQIVTAPASKTGQATITIEPDKLTS